MCQVRAAACAWLAALVLPQLFRRGIIERTAELIRETQKHNAAAARSHAKARRRKLRAVLAASPAAAGPPFITDDPEPVELHHWEVYIASIGAMNKEDGVRDTFSTLPHVEVNYGALPELQLHVIAPLALDEQGGNLHYGFGDTELGAKYRFVKESGWIPQIGTFPLIELPTGNADEGLGNGKAQYFFPIWLQKSWGKWTTYGGGGYWLNQGKGNRDWWYFGWLLQRQLTDSLLLGAELYQTTPDSMGATARTGFNIGAVYDFDEHHHLMASIGRDFVGRTQLAYYVAFQFTF